MIIKHYYNLSDHQVQYQITDSQSFKDFLGLASGDKVPDEKTSRIRVNRFMQIRPMSDNATYWKNGI